MLEPKIEDRLGRTFKTLRISLIPYCNLSCIYCVNEKHKTEEIKSTPLSFSEIANIVEVLHDVLNFTKIRLTGGEPTLYHDLVPLTQTLSKNIEVPLHLTTNGVRLFSMLPKLATTNLRSLNISLDSMSESNFNKISGRSGLSSILKAIEESVKLGFSVKINTVVLKGINHEEIVPLTEFARSLDIPIRFLELMRMGHLFSEQFENYFFSKDEIVKSLEEVYTLSKEIRKPSATSEYWQLDQGGRVGIIANESAPFCKDCDRLRLDSFGNIYGCLSTNEAIAIHDALQNQDSLKRKLLAALDQKQMHGFVGSEMSMLKIGG